MSQMIFKIFDVYGIKCNSLINITQEYHICNILPLLENIYSCSCKDE